MAGPGKLPAPPTDPDQPLTFAQLAALIPPRSVRRPRTSRETVRKWATVGLHGVVLGSVEFLGRYATTWAHFERFCAEVKRVLDERHEKARRAAREARDLPKRLKKVREQLDRLGIG